MAEPVIEIQAVAKRFGSTTVLKDVNLTVPAGQTFAFLGRNGAGKTTTIRMLLGLLKPDSGQIRVLGLEPQRDAVEIRQRVGYLAEDQAMFGWMRVEQMLRFMEPFYPKWDRAWAATLSERFALPMKTKIKHLSKGQNVRLGLLLALAHRPRLVILDDPTLGLDPIMRKEFLRDVVTFLQGENVTVFFSSHLLYEVEPVADAVAILDRGRIIRCAPTEELREQVKLLLMPAEMYEAVRPLPGTRDVKHHPHRVAVVVEDIGKVMPTFESRDLRPEIVDLNLDEIFETYVIGQPEGAAPSPQLTTTAGAR